MEKQRYYERTKNRNIIKIYYTIALCAKQGKIKIIDVRFQSFI